MPYSFSGFPPASTIDELQRLVEEELRKVALSAEERDFLMLRPIYVEPARPREGMIVYADGTVWDPGSGRGIYRYDGAWSQVST